MSPRNKKKGFKNDWRMRFVFLGFLLSFLSLIFRLFQIQILDHKKYRARAEGQYLDQSDIPAKRGNIYSADGYLLAGARSNYLLFAEPKKIEDPEKTASDLAKLLSDIRFGDGYEAGSDLDSDIEEENSKTKFPTKKETYEKYFNDFKNSISKDLFWVPVIRDITPEEKKLIEDSKIPNLGFEEYPARYYPEGSLASHVLGFVASDEKGEKIGYFGIEGKLNEELKGKSGRIIEDTDAVGNPILMGKYKEIPPVQGRDVILTINRSVQYIVEKKLKEDVEKYGAISGTVIIMNPFTGDIIAMANYPTYDPADFNEKEEVDPNTGRKNLVRKNSAIADTYEPGSVMKPMTVSAAIDLGIVNPLTTFVDSGPVKYSDYVIDNWDGGHHGVQTVTELLQKSNNIGAAWVGHQVGAEKLYEYFYDFGIGSKTGVDLEGEDTGILRNSKDWTDIDTANISFGQGMSATTLQVLNAFNVIANGGNLVQPKIISKIIDEKGEHEIPTKIVKRVISKKTADTMVDLLEKAAEGGEAKYFTLKDYRISGKTGTAQIPEGGGYSPNKTNATFVGFLTSNKTLSMIVKFDQPKTSVYAAETSAPTWMSLISELVKFYGIPPDFIIEEKEPMPVQVEIE
jgi:cell division protein FtsI/penicillin-binding protein 2